MRVISGIYRSRVIKTLTTKESRPTLDQVKGAVFNHLGNLREKVLLDLFCGCGNIGIEAVSRGALKVVFNDLNYQAILVLKSNLETLKIENHKYEVYNWPYDRLLDKLEENFDFIYLDPPFATDYLLTALEGIYLNSLLKKDGEIICESELNTNLDNPWFIIVKTQKYGRIKISYLRKKDNE